jgi:L-cystine transport system permease protein
MSRVEYFIHALGVILQALPVTLMISLNAFVISVFLAFLFAVVRIKKIKILCGVIVVLQSFLRGTPPIVQLFIVFYGLPMILQSIGIDTSNISVYVFPSISLALNSAAFLSEIMRSAWFGVETGQKYAAYSIGMGNFQAFRRILLPQAFKIALPNLGTFTMSILHDTAFVFSVGVVDIMGRTIMLSASSYGLYQTENYIIVSLVYWSMCILIQKGTSLLEQRYGRGFAG